MYVTRKMLAVKYGCSESTIRRITDEMEASGMYPRAARRIKGVEFDDEQFEEYCTRRRRNEKTIRNSDGGLLHH